MVVKLAAIMLFAAASQDVHEYRSSGRGSSAENRLAATDLAELLAVDCAVTNASRRGQDAAGAAHFEVSCESGPGYLLIDATPPRAISCLALAASLGQHQARRQNQCQLPTNRIDLTTWRAVAIRAGINCDVDEGAMLGVNAAGREIHEIGCRGVAGYRIERGENDDWTTTDCLTLFARGDACAFTSAAEATASFARWLAPAGMPGCEPSAVRFMGEDGQDRYFEVACTAGTNLVARLDDENRLVETITCSDASRIGNGCLARP